MPGSSNVEKHEAQVIDQMQLLGEHELRDDQHHRGNREAEQEARKNHLAGEVERANACAIIEESHTASTVEVTDTNAEFRT